MSKVLQRVLLALFVILDVFLVVVAVRHVNGTPPTSDLPAAAATTAAPSASPTATSGSDTPTTATPDTSSQVEYEFDAAAAVAMASSNDGTVIFGTRGRCADAPATVQISTNGGRNFATRSTGLTTTLAVAASSANSISVVGTDGDCKVKQIASVDAGKSWTDADDVTLWYPAPDNDKTVVSPSGPSEPGTGCVVTSVSQVTAASARVSCADGMFKGSGDNGATWVDLGRLDNVRVGTFLTPSGGFALARYNGCGANEFSTTDGGVTWTPGGCISGDPAQAISATTNGLAAVVADQFYTSADNGESWMQP